MNLNCCSPIIKIGIKRNFPRKEYTVSYVTVLLMNHEKIITIVQCILFPVSPYIARELCLMSKNLVDNMFLTFFIMLTISFWLGIWKLGDLVGNPK